ncbi:NUDIX hydrolase [Nonomuraea sp. NPDC046570]|uniref:NUDIX hydrolase n=1 Tax=Nonomuraea sp. NPDC046570 TaxID=3155255 RepID=UPI0033DA51F6
MAAKDGDGWAECARGHRHWGVHGASGLLAVHHDERGTARVLMQERAVWSHHGGTWGLPGGARDSHEDAVAGALREAHEEATVDGAKLDVTGVYLDDHGGWTFETVIAEAAELLDVVPANAESSDLRWLTLDEIPELKLHPGFAETWGEVQLALSPATLVLDMANIVGARAEHGWWKDRAGANAKLLREVAGRSFRHPILARWHPKVVAVVEGAARTATAPDRVTVAQAVHSGDDTIVEVVRQAKPWETVLVITADRGLRERVTGLGAAVSGPRWLLDQL